MKRDGVTVEIRRPINPKMRHARNARDATGEVLPLQVLESAAGFYLGAATEDEGPISRESLEYWPTRIQAERALASGDWNQLDGPC